MKRGILVAAVVIFGMIAASAQGAIRLKVKYVVNDKRVESNERARVSARCPDGYRVLSGGVASPISTIDPFTTIGTSAPTSGHDGWVSRVDNVTDERVTFTGSAICGKGTLLRGLVYPRRAVNIPVGTQGAVTANCPNGKRVIGGGESYGGGYRTAQLQSTLPADGPDNGTDADDAWRIWMDVLTGTDSRRVTAFAVCGGRRLTRALTYVQEQETIFSGFQSAAFADCPGAKKVLGGGVNVSTPYNTTSINTTAPGEGDDGDTRLNDAWISWVDNYELGGDASAQGYAICRKVPDGVSGGASSRALRKRPTGSARRASER